MEEKIRQKKAEAKKKAEEKLKKDEEFKAKWNGRKYIKIDTFYASSELCSVCGYQNPDTKDLSVS